MTAGTTVDFDRFAEPHLADPYPLYRQVREQTGAFFADAFGMWIVTRYEDVKTVLTDSARFSSAYLIRTPHQPAPGVTEILAEGHPEIRMLLNEDPPDHARTRALVSKAFSPRRITDLQPRVQLITDELIDAFADTGRADLVRQLSWPLPLRVICELIGLPRQDAEQIRAWADDLAQLTSFGATADEQRAAAAGSVAVQHYLADQIDQRRRAGRGDLLTALIAADADGADPLSTDELISLLIILVFAGHETTANLIGNAFLLLLQRPELWAAAHADPRLVDAVVEETLRVDAPVQGMFRVAVTDTDLAGVTIPAGAQVFALIGSANHDPAAFTDPDAVHPDRPGTDRHLSFGHGIHFCIGAALARAEARTAITTLARRVPGIRLAPDFRAPYLPNLLHRGPHRLDTTWP